MQISMANDVDLNTLRVGSHAKRLHRGAAPISNEVVTEFQSDRARTDLPVRVLHASQVVRLKRVLLTDLAHPPR
jgi:hypothetical protein